MTAVISKNNQTVGAPSYKLVYQPCELELQVAPSTFYWSYVHQLT